jgi:hypothetical protein
VAATKTPHRPARRQEGRRRQSGVATTTGGREGSLPERSIGGSPETKPSPVWPSHGGGCRRRCPAPRGRISVVFRSGPRSGDESRSRPSVPELVTFSSRLTWPWRSRTVRRDSVRERHLVERHSQSTRGRRDSTTGFCPADASWSWCSSRSRRLFASLCCSN